MLRRFSNLLRSVKRLGAAPRPARLQLEHLEERVVPALPDGVAAGDTTQTSVVLWTRSTVTGTVNFTYSTTSTFDTTLSAGSATVTDPTQPVKVMVNGLTPGTTYYYRATDAAGDSAQGTFRTPFPNDVHAGVTFGVSGDERGELAPYVSISNVPSQNLDFFLNEGDTIYADFSSPDVPAAQAQTLADFRAKENEVYAPRNGVDYYADLRASTSTFVTIDDHEVADNFSGGAPPQTDVENRPVIQNQPGQLLSDSPIYQNTIQAFEEYNPIQNLTYPTSSDDRTSGKPDLYRFREYGQDAAFFMLDERTFRDRNLNPVNDPTNQAAVASLLAGAYNPNRTLLGSPQLQALEQNLVQAQADNVTWKFVMTNEPIEDTGVIGLEDHYTGFAAERAALLKFIGDNKISNVVFVAADFHGTLTNQVSYRTTPTGPQIQTGAVEVITGPIAFDQPFGPTVVGLGEQAGLVSPSQAAAYNSLPEGDAKESIITGLVNSQLAPLGDNLLSLKTDPLPNVHLQQGSYVETDVYGWTKFSIDPLTQELTVTTYGVKPYSQADLLANPAAILAEVPQIVSQFTVDPSGQLVGGTVFADPTGTGASTSSTTGLAGKTVFVDANGNGVLDKGELSTVTNAKGQYLFSGLTPGTYTVRELVTPQDGLVPSNGNTLTVALTGKGAVVSGNNIGDLPTSPAAPVPDVPTPAGPRGPTDAASTFVRGLYLSILGRSGGTGEVAFWAGQLNGGLTQTRLGQVFWESAEHRGQQVDGYYQAFLGHAADAAGRAFWVGQFQAGLGEAAVVQGFLSTPEYTATHPDSASFLNGLYSGLLGRSADSAGLTFYGNQLSAGTSRAALVNAFVNSSESAGRVLGGFFGAYLRRAADQAGRQFWTGVLQNANGSFETTAVGFLTSGEFTSRAQASL